MRYIVINRSPYVIDLIIPAPHRDTSISLMVEPSNSVDILPFSGSIQECRRIAQLHNLQCRGWVEIQEEL